MPFILIRYCYSCTIIHVIKYTKLRSQICNNSPYGVQGCLQLVVYMVQAVAIAAFDYVIFLALSARQYEIM